MPDEHVSTVLTSADLGVEILIGTGRVNRIPLANPWEDSFVADPISTVADEVAGLDAGDRMLIDRPALQVLAGYRLIRSTASPVEATIVPSGVAYLQRGRLRMIGERFGLRTVAHRRRRH